ncbi:histone H1-like [Anoplopoma fimbria]|uniref:histone H1-like n=2 Tax=Anoplopoma fimbria TaxID=229290 RepID=UPI0023EC5004|nr:histone H1-like [Anoplopoma fimbria]
MVCLSSFLRSEFSISHNRLAEKNRYSTMAELAPVAAPVAPVKTPKKKVSKPSKKTGPGAGELILKAVAASKGRSGISYVAVKKYMAAEGYDVKQNSAHVKRAVKKLLAGGALVQLKGSGATGSFKAAKPDEKPKKAVKKTVAKPAVKKPAVKKPAAKKAAAVAKKPKAKTTPKKAKKPATAKNTSVKKLTKSPKKKPVKKAETPKKAAKKVVKPKAAKPAKKAAAKKPAKKAAAKKPAKK